MSDLSDRLAAAVEDRYRIERELGRGGMAVVYLARDLKHGRKVALKVLSPELASQIGPERFLREIEIAAGLSHPHILPLFDSGEADGLLYFVMPYVEGESLRDRVDREGPLPVDDALRIVGEVAGALSRAHEQGVVHRDVKPENILFEAGHALVSDFGIARAVDAASGERLTQTGFFVGTPTYMSPEQATGSAAIDGRSDTYSLACIAYEMLAGEPPFAAPTPQAVLARHVVDVPPPVREIRPEVPAGMERALEQALAKDPADRYATPTEFAEALAEAATAQAIAAEHRRLKGARRVRGLVGATALALLVAGGWWVATALGGPRFERLAVLPPANLMDDPEQEYLVQGVHNALISELQQAGIAVIARTSVMQYADTDKPAREIATELGVDALVESFVLRAGDSVDVEVRLVDGDTQEYVGDPIARRGDLSNVLALYRDLTRAIAIEIQAVLTPEAEARLAEASPVDPQAYEAYLRGVFHSQRFTEEDLNTALEYFETALEIDSTYAPAYVGIARVWTFRAQSGVVSADDAREHWETALERALERDSTLADAHMLDATTRAWAEWDWEGAEAAFRRAIQLNPGNPEARAFYGHLLTILGRWEEAAEEAKIGLELDPRNPFVQMLYAVRLVMVRRYEEAIEFLEDIFRRNPGAGFARDPLGDALHQVGRDEEAFQLQRDQWEARGARDVVVALDRGYEQAGYRGAYRLAADTLAVRVGTAYASPIGIARFYTLAGETENAVDWLEEAFEARGQNMPYIGLIPSFEVLHDHTRFRDLARRMNVPLLTGPEN